MPAQLGRVVQAFYMPDRATDLNVLIGSEFKITLQPVRLTQSVMAKCVNKGHIGRQGATISRPRTLYTDAVSGEQLLISTETF